MKGSWMRVWLQVVEMITFASVKVRHRTNSLHDISLQRHRRKELPKAGTKRCGESFPNAIHLGRTFGDDA
jgi:heme exporter protein D